MNTKNGNICSNNSYYSSSAGDQHNSINARSGANSTQPLVEPFRVGSNNSQENRAPSLSRTNLLRRDAFAASLDAGRDAALVPPRLELSPTALRESEAQQRSDRLSYLLGVALDIAVETEQMLEGDWPDDPEDDGDDDSDDSEGGSLRAADQLLLLVTAAMGRILHTRRRSTNSK